MARTERRLEITDSEVLAALAHPLRVALLFQLDALGSRTASQCAQALGQTPANCSYHLRQLAKVGLAAVAQGVFTVLFVVFVARELGGDGADTGLLRGVQAIGGLLGGVLVVGLARRLEPGRLAGISLLAFGVVDLAIWNGPLLTTALALYLGLFVAAGIPGIGFLTGMTALVQAGTGDAYLGRVFATFFGVFNGLTGSASWPPGCSATPSGWSPCSTARPPCTCWPAWSRG